MGKAPRFPAREADRTNKPNYVRERTRAGQCFLSPQASKPSPPTCMPCAEQDYMERNLAPADPSDRWATLWRSAQKSVAAGVAGAALTNPLDVLRNEMFKTDLGVRDALIKLRREEGASFAVRGMNKNLVAVAIPIAVTIFSTDVLVRMVEK